MKNKYGYKIFYRQYGKQKMKLYLVTNTYTSVKRCVRWYESHSPPDKQTKRLLEDVTWLIIPIKTYPKYKRLWRGCLF